MWLMELARNLKIDSVSRLHPRAPLCLPPDRTVADAIRLMCQERVGCVLIAHGERLAGIFTERDLMRRVLADGKPLTLTLGDVMTADPVVVSRKENVAAAVRRMEEGGYRHLPVVDEAGRPVGVLSVKRIVRYLVEHFPALVYNLPPNPGAVPRKPEGA
jgi:CBS domain-containing protein